MKIKIHILFIDINFNNQKNYFDIFIIIII